MIAHTRPWSQRTSGTGPIAMKALLDAKKPGPGLFGVQLPKLERQLQKLDRQSRLDASPRLAITRFG